MKNCMSGAGRGVPFDDGLAFRTGETSAMFPMAFSLSCGNQK